MVGEFLKNKDKDYHPIFKEELEKVSQYLEQMEINNEIQEDEEMILSS